MLQVPNEYGMLKVPQFHYTWDSTWSNFHLAGSQAFAVVPFWTTAKQKSKKGSFQHCIPHFSAQIFSFKIHVIHQTGMVKWKEKKKKTTFQDEVACVAE